MVECGKEKIGHQQQKKLNSRNMKTTKNFKIVLIPVGLQCDQKVAGHLENLEFKNMAALQYQLFHQFFKDETKPAALPIEILTVEEFKEKNKLATRVIKALDIALSNGLSPYGYNMSEFMDEYNNQVFAGKTDNYWLVYVRV